MASPFVDCAATIASRTRYRNDFRGNGFRNHDRLASLAMTVTARVPQAGQLLREWRARRNLSQLRLASGAAVSARHLSFIETGRARPSREMLLHLADRLEIPPPERK